MSNNERADIVSSLEDILKTVGHEDHNVVKQARAFLFDLQDGDVEPATMLTSLRILQTSAANIKKRPFKKAMIEFTNRAQIFVSNLRSGSRSTQSGPLTQAAKVPLQGTTKPKDRQSNASQLPDSVHGDGDPWRHHGSWKDDHGA